MNFEVLDVNYYLNEQAVMNLGLHFDFLCVTILIIKEVVSSASWRGTFNAAQLKKCIRLWITHSA